MKFLKYRKDFLNQENDFSNQIKTSNLIKEQHFENDIKWGDSYIGRLFNSTLNIVTTGAKMITIPFLLNSLKNQLRLMVDRISMDQINRLYPTLFLKTTLEEIKNVCVSNLSEPEKLKILIGWDGTTQMYDSSNPKKDIPGFYEGGKLVNSLVQDCYNKISDPNNRVGLEKAFNPNIIKLYLDILSDFMVDLRKLTSNVKISPTTPIDSEFKKNLLDSLNKLTQINLTTESKKVKFLKYDSFINEDTSTETTSTENISKLVNLASNLLSKIESMSDEQIKVSEEFKEFNQILNSLTKEELDILNKNQIVSQLQSLTTKSNPSNQLSERYTNYIKLILDDKLNEWFISSSSTTISPSTTSTSGTTGPQGTQGNQQSVGNQGITGPQGTQGPQGNQSSSGTQGTTGTQGSVGTQGVGSSTTPTEPKNVQELWNKFFTEVDKVLPAKMTQDDVEKLKSFKPEDLDLASAITKRPDPLYKIVRIFETANSIFTTNEIPSRRTGGQVWPVTYNRFKFVGSGTPGGHEKPGPGPWVHKPLFGQWTKGVMEILSDPTYSKIFSEISGAFAKNESLILEKDDVKDTISPNTKKQALQEFFLDMLDIKNQGDFSSFVNKALKRYFGLSVDTSKLIGDKKGNVQTIETEPENIEPNSFAWENFNKTAFDNGDMNKQFAFRVDDLRKSKGNKNYKLIFIRPIKLVGDKVEIKFTFNNQQEANILMNDGVYSKYKKEDISSDKPENYVYYGIMLNDFKDGFKVTYCNVGDSLNKSFVADPLYGEPSSPGSVIFKLTNSKITLASGDSKIIGKRQLVSYDDKKAKQEVKNNSIKISYETTSDKFYQLPTTSNSKLGDALISLGKDPKYGYWS